MARGVASPDLCELWDKLDSKMAQMEQATRAELDTRFSLIEARTRSIPARHLVRVLRAMLKVYAAEQGRGLISPLRTPPLGPSEAHVFHVGLPARVIEGLAGKTM